MNNHTKVRIATKKDLNLLCALATTTFFEAYFEQDVSRDLGDYCVKAFNLNQLKIEMEDTNSSFLIAEYDKKAVGYAKLREGKLPDCIEKLDSIEIQRIYLLEKMKRKGIGKILMENCYKIALSKKYSNVWLGVWSQNKKAIEFYEKLGFIKTGTIEFEYGSGRETNFVMNLEI